MRGFKKSFIILGLMVFGVVAMNAQQKITNFGIVDTDKVYSHFYRNSSAVKSYEKKRSDMQKEINEKTEELRELKSQKDALEESGDIVAAEAIDASIKDKTDYLREYTTTKNAELQELKKNLSESNDFYIKLSKTIKRVAENEGLSMILSLQGNTSILWYSHQVDVTDQVIKEMER